ncbi:MAG TPA: hybrid sensor histidine kinase/response regulator [Chloroflexi bacterium]|nr:hybrid sensor histidine kinase/response regulator [Chloroflexota bacterium]
MSLAVKVREQLISSFRAELAEHVQTMNEGLLALEQDAVEGEQRKTLLEDVFRAAHSLKGAARAMGVTMIEQLAHVLESVLADLQKEAIVPNTRLFTACYRTVDAIQKVQKTYEAGETTPPVEALQALSDLEQAHAEVRAGVEHETVAKIPEDRDEEKLFIGSVETPDQGVDADVSGLPSEAGERKVLESTPQVANENEQEEKLEEVSSGPVFGADETIRVSVSKLDALMAQLSELLVTKIRAEQRLGQIRRLQELAAAWQKEWLAARSAYNRLARYELAGAFGINRLGPVDVAPGKDRPREKGKVRTDVEQVGVGTKVGKDIAQLLRYVSDSQECLRELITYINDLVREYANDAMHMSLVIDELEQEVKRVRMLPLTTITSTFGRMVRDLAQESGKEAVLQIVGGETELDKRVLEQIKDPLIHLLRNAVDHGLEAPHRRLALGKARAGTITLKAEQLGKDVVIRVADDGSGLDLEAIRHSIARRGGLDASALGEEDLKEVIFNAGVSTSPIITDISGRGVGLDVVRRNVEALHGRIDVESIPDKGTSFILTLPLTLTSSRGLLVRAFGELFAIPHNAIEYIMYVKPDDIAPLEGRDTIVYKKRPLALVRLGSVLGLSPVEEAHDRARIPVVILAAAERRMAFVLDALAGEQEVVIKGLGKQLSRVGGIAGATVMGSGEVVLILNVADLIKLGLRGDQRSVLAALARPAPVVEAQRRFRILVVDDSITTRTLEKNILEAAGYAVELATDGQEALGAIASSGIPDLIVSDVVMPRLDGFELTQRIREDPRIADVPVILVTSLDSAEDKAKGIEVGADAYITKNTFDQNSLLETIEQLL